MSVADAFRTNQSIRKLNVETSERLSDECGNALLQVVHGHSSSWQSTISSNHTLQHVYVPEGSDMSKDTVTKLQSITTVSPLNTLQAKAWEYINRNIGNLSEVGLGQKLVPHFISFVSTRGGVNSMFNFLRSRYVTRRFFYLASLPLLFNCVSNSRHENRDNDQEMIFGIPTPERFRLQSSVNEAKHKNAMLRLLLKSEREFRQSIRSEHSRLRDREEEEKNDIARCLFLPFFKVLDVCRYFINKFIKETPRHT